ncbi:MAG: TIGR03960 family B12-binding radical SAM protein [Cyanobium sp.]
MVGRPQTRVTVAPAPSSPSQAPVDFDALIDLAISKPARYLGNELGVQPRAWDADWQVAGVRWALTYPEVYEVGASNSGHIILYSILNSVPGQLCDRAYLPAADLATRLRERGIPLFAVESRRPLKAFDILGFSLSYELGGTNILEMLDLAGIPLHAAERGDLPLDHPEAPPLIFAGGPTATSNPEPFAAFFDFIALGDGEELLPEIGLVVAEGRAAGLHRWELLRDLAQVPGVYVPALYGPGPDGVTILPLEADLPQRIRRRTATPMPHYATGLVPHIETVHDRLTVEIRRGCTRGCRFCQPGMLTRPARDVDPAEVIAAVEEGMGRTGYADFSLLSLSCSDYLALPAVGVELRNRLAEHNISLTLPSQRVDRFDAHIAHILGGTRQAGLTFAPEAGSQRLRDVINKGLSDADLLRGMRTAMENGYRKVKLYFMVGLPGETDGDVLGIADTCRRLQQDCADLGRLQLNLTISTFTPKPHTPFQWHSVSHGEIRRRQELLRQALRGLRGVKTNFTDTRLAAIEDFIGRGDRRLSPVIEAAWRAGAGLDAWFESAERSHAAWTAAIEGAGLGGRYRALELGDWAAVEALHSNDLDAFCRQPLPWDHLDTGIEKTWLAEDLQRALAAAEVPDCSFAACSHCGVCGPELGHNVVIPPPPVPPALPSRKPPSERICRLRFGFSKRGSLAWISHLDTLRMLHRALRRSGLPVSFTGGFHPLPRLQIALPLPLGVEGLEEWLDLELVEPLQPQETTWMLQRLQHELPEGLRLQSCEVVPLQGPSLSQELVGARWWFVIQSEGSGPEAQGREWPAAEAWESALQTLMQKNTWIWNDHDKKGRLRQRDCRPALRKVDVVPHAGPDHQVELVLETTIDAQGFGVRPEHLRHWLSTQLDLPLRLGRQRRVALVLRSEAAC